jgi:hypothetical protein
MWLQMSNFLTATIFNMSVMCKAFGGHNACDPVTWKQNRYELF